MLSVPQDFFSKFPGFDHDPAVSLTTGFAKLALDQNWKAGSTHYRNKYQECIATEFHFQYGGDAGRLAGWQALCVDVRIRPLPNSITQCKKALSKVAVNIMDLSDAKRTGEDVYIFSSKNALRDYTIQTERIFSK
ncbi:hypothetical protein MMC14_008222 [Varicellaria rhodocarpa]|nr:hypothetical protein [Varicellaria rhodocarpa]